MHSRVDSMRSASPIGSPVTTSRHAAPPLARSLLLDSTMRFSQLRTLALLCAAAACTASPGRKSSTSSSTGSGSGSDSTDDTTCDRLDEDVTIRTTADLADLPSTGCYDIYGKLIVQGAAITSLAGVHGLNSVDELELDGTGLTTIDTPRQIGIYGKLTLTNNTKLTNLAPLVFQAPVTGLLIDHNAALTTLDPLVLSDPALVEVDGDVAITNNAALTAVPLGHLTRITGALTITGNAAAKTIDLGKLAATGRVEISSNTALTAISAFGATTIAGDLAVRNNPALTSIATLSALYRVTGGVAIDSNAALTNLGAFTTSLQYIDGALAVTNNKALTDLGALKHTSLIGAITVTGNQNLVICRAIELDRCVSHAVTSTITNNKDVACNWQCVDP